MSKLIIDLRPDVKKMCGLFLCNTLDAGLNAFITHTLRSFILQDDLWSIGRIGNYRNNKIITNALAGWSVHNYALAFDIALKTKTGTLIWDITKDVDKDGTSEWKEIGQCVKPILGLEWSGDWKGKFKEMCHIQSTECSIIQLQQSKFIVLSRHIETSKLFNFHLQTYLKKMKIYTGKIDGIIGTKSKEAMSIIGVKYKKNAWTTISKIMMLYFDELTK